MRITRLGLLGAFLIPTLGFTGCGGESSGYNPPEKTVVNAPVEKDLQAQLERQIHMKPVKKTWKPNSHR